MRNFDYYVKNFNFIIHGIDLKHVNGNVFVTEHAFTKCLPDNTVERLKKI